MLAGSATGRLLGAVRMLILVRLLTPHDYGLVAIGLTLLALYEGVSSLGTHLALIQRREGARDMFDTAWTLGLIRGALLAVAQLALAPTLAAFFRAPDALPIARVLALHPILRAFKNVAIVELRRELTLRPHYLILTAATLSEMAVAIPLAISLRSAWALVGGMLAADLSAVILSYVLYPYRPALRLRRSQVRELVAYGRWVTGSAALQKLRRTGVQAVIGRWLSVEALGLYETALRVARLPGEATQIVSGVTLSAYAKLQDSPERLRQAYVRTLKAVTLCVMPIGIGVALHAADLVEVVLGSQWRPVVPLLQVMSVFGLTRAVGDTTDPLFAGAGRPWLQTRTKSVELFLVALTIGPLIAMAGVVGAAWAVSASAIAAGIVGLWAAARLLQIPAREMLGILAGPLLACVPPAATRLWLVGPFEAALPLAGGLVLFGLLYVAGIIMLDRWGLYRIDAIIDREPWRRGVALLWEEIARR
jgi:PST family polysaccharide transporter/lipopolysaccharide exporter